MEPSGICILNASVAPNARVRKSISAFTSGTTRYGVTAENPSGMGFAMSRPPRQQGTRGDPARHVLRRIPQRSRWALGVLPTSLAEFLAPLRARLLHLALARGAPEPVELRHAECPLLHPVAGEAAGLGLVEDLADLGLVDDARAAAADGELRRPA